MHERLRNALAAGHTIITPSTRLARLVRLEVARSRTRSGSSAWAPPAILAWHEWLARLYEDLRWTSSGTARARLNPSQEQRIWEQLVADNVAGDLQGSGATARQARIAWGMLHAWRLPDPSAAPFASEEVRAFARWTRDYRARCDDEAWLDAARLPDVLCAAIDASIIAPPSGVLVLGFEQLTPQQGALLRAIAARGARVAVSRGPCVRANARRVELVGLEDELTTAARWARRLLASEGAGSIAILVPDLAARRGTAERVLDDVLGAGAMPPDCDDTRPPFNISAGTPLADHAIVRAARAVLTSLAGRVTLADLSRILRSPFVAGGVSQAPRRAMLDAWLREQAVVELDLGALRRFLARHAQARTHPADVALEGALERAEALLPPPGTRWSLDIWATAMSRLLNAFGWPGERTLTAAEQATVTALQAAVARFASLELVQSPVDARGALRLLTALLAREPFQVESPEAPVQVLDVADACGAGFDGMWITGLDDERWPPPPDPNPFIPLEWQRTHELPGATPEIELARARRTTRRLLRSCTNVIVSHAVRDGDRTRGPSPLVRSLERCEVQDLALADTPRRGFMPSAMAPLETLRDSRAPALGRAGTTRGGTRALRLQAACPFRAFGELRLRATPIATPSSAPDARLRGVLMHAALERLWRRLGSSAALQALDEAGVAGVVAQAVEDALATVAHAHALVLPPRRRGVEAARLARTLRAWLAVERQRAAFEVHALEAQGTLRLGAMTLGTRADRVDRLADGTLVIIDYKSGAGERRAPGAWGGARPDEPQLPSYALAERGPLAGLFMAHVRPGRPAFSGIARAAGIVPGVGADTTDAAGAAHFDELRAHWRDALERLAADYVQGEARVDPKHGWQTCRRCELALLCRVAEQAALAEARDA